MISNTPAENAILRELFHCVELTAKELADRLKYHTSTIYKAIKRLAMRERVEKKNECYRLTIDERLYQHWILNRRIRQEAIQDPQIERENRRAIIDLQKLLLRNLLIHPRKERI